MLCCTLKQSFPTAYTTCFSLGELGMRVVIHVTDLSFWNSESESLIIFGSRASRGAEVQRSMHSILKFTTTPPFKYVSVCLNESGSKTSGALTTQLFCPRVFHWNHSSLVVVPYLGDPDRSA